MNRRHLGIWIPIAVGILIETGLAIEVNLASNKVPQFFSQAGVLLVGLAVVLGLTFFLRLREQRRPGPAREDHARRRLINRAENILGHMSSAVLDEAGLGQLDLRVSVALPLEPESQKRFPRAVERTAEMKMSVLPDYVDQSLDGRALIVGEPGGGKSMLMRTIALRSVERSRGSTAQVPLWLDMEEWPDGASLESWVLDSLAVRRITGENAEELLRNNDLYLFLDGLDQIPTADGQRRAFKATEDFLRRYELCHLVMTARADAYAALGAAAEQLPLVRISPLSPAEVGAQLRRVGSPAAGLRRAAARDADLSNVLGTPLFLKAGLRAFRGRGSRAILDLRRTGSWDDAILAELVRLVLLEQQTPAVRPEPLLRYLRWVAKVFVAGGVTSFYGFVPPRRLLDEANRHPRVKGFRTAAAVLAGALGAAVAGWLLIGPRTGIGAAVLGAASVYLLTRAMSAQMDLEMVENKDTVTWSLSALRTAAPSLGARLAAAVALAGLVQFAASYEIDHALRLGDMTSATATRTRLYVAAILVVLLVSYMRRAAAKVGRIVDPDNPVAMDLPMDNRKTPRAWWLRLPDLSVAFWSAGLFLLPALIWTVAYQLLASLGPAHLRYATVQTAFHRLLQLMDFPPDHRFTCKWDRCGSWWSPPSDLASAPCSFGPSTSIARTGLGSSRPLASATPDRPATTWSTCWTTACNCRCCAGSKAGTPSTIHDSWSSSAARDRALWTFLKGYRELSQDPPTLAVGVPGSGRVRGLTSRQLHPSFPGHRPRV